MVYHMSQFINFELKLYSDLMWYNNFKTQFALLYAVAWPRSEAGGLGAILQTLSALQKESPNNLLLRGHP